MQQTIAKPMVKNQQCSRCVVPSGHTDCQRFTFFLCSQVAQRINFTDAITKLHDRAKCARILAGGEGTRITLDSVGRTHTKENSACLRHNKDYVKYMKPYIGLSDIGISGDVSLYGPVLDPFRDIWKTNIAPYKANIKVYRPSIAVQWDYGSLLRPYMIDLQILKG